MSPAARHGATAHAPVPLALDADTDLQWWVSLTQGDRVQIRCQGKVMGCGTVDTLTPDGTAIWLWLEYGLGRVMVLPAEGFRLFRLAERTAAEHLPNDDLGL